MLLRPHHGLCIGFFEGKGYSERFVRHMTETIARLCAENPEITLVTHCDVLCDACPHNIGDVCESDEKVSHYDNAVLTLCGLSGGDTLRWSAFRERVKAQILREKKLEAVCGDCMWYDICKAKEGA